MEVPSLLRHFVLADGADADFALLQTIPDPSICADVTTVISLGITYVAYTALGAVATGCTLSLQLIDISLPIPHNAQAFPTLITGAPTDTNVPIGEGLEYDVSNCRLITMRVASITAGDAVTANIFWRALK